METYYAQFLAKIQSQTFDAEEYRKRIHDHSLDEIMQILVQLGIELQQLRRLFSQGEAAMNKLCEKTEAHIQQLQQDTISFYIQYLADNPYIGEKQAFDAPDIIVLLGCNQPLFDHRLNSALTLIQQRPHAILFCSGAGFNLLHSESDYMLHWLRDRGVKNRIVQEQDSMDTLGNALFTKLTLKHEQLLKQCRRLLIITSDFHAPRSLYYFTSIFGGSSGVESFAVAGVSTPQHQLNLSDIIKHELSTEYQAKSTHLLGNSAYNLTEDDEAILISLILRHKYYAERYDLLRKYLAYC